MKPITHWSVKLTIFTICIIMLTTCFTTACQPTPEEVVVRSKAGDDLKNAIEATASPVTNDSGETQTIEGQEEAQYKVLKRLEGTLNNDQKNIEIDLNADVLVPNQMSIPVAVVERASFDQEQVDAIIGTLFGDVTLYHLNSPLTKSQIEDEIIKLRRSSEDLSSDMAQSEGITSLEDLKKRGNQLIAEYEKMYETAPEDLVNYEASTDISSKQVDPISGDEMDGLMIKGYINGDDTYAALYLYKADWGDGIDFDNGPHHSYYIKTYLRERDKEQADYIDAKKLAEETVASMGLDEFTLNDGFKTSGFDMDAEEGDHYYVFSFNRRINGVGISSGFHNVVYDDEDNDPSYAETLDYEKMMLWIDGDRVVRFEWNSPHYIRNIVNEDVKIEVDIEETIDTVSNQLYMQYADMYYGQVDKIIVDINQIKMDLARVRYKGHPGEYILVPVWDFYGNVKVEVDEGSSFMETLKMKERVYPIVDGLHTINNPLEESIITVNALDGTIINRDIGY